MKIFTIVVVTASFFFSFRLNGQMPGSFGLNETLIESLESSGAGDDDYESILKELDALKSNPVNLNLCSRADLEKLPFLTDFQITSFLDYKKEHGNLMSVYELQAINGFNQDVIRMMLPFVTVEVAPVSQNAAKGRAAAHEASFRLQRYLQKSKGYSTPDPSGTGMRYPGSPWLLNARYELSLSDRIRFGLTVEKDPGEEIFRGSNRGFDYTSAFVMAANAGPFKTLLLGDYRLAFGQGLTLWNGTAPGKSSMPLSIVKRQDAVKAYTSNDENNFFRGVASTAVKGRFALTVFFSSKSIDANITDTIARDHICFSSFQESGYHRTSSEITDEKSVRETVWGANLIYRNDFLKLGSTFVHSAFSKYMIPGDELRNMYEFSGNSLTNFGVDYSVILKKIQLFGETSYGNNHMATLNGILLNTGKYASLALLYRNYSKGYFSMHSSAFSEGSDDFNEEGLYAGIVLHPVRHLRISAYGDFYRFPWLKYHQSKPAAGNDFLVQADYSAGKADMYLRVKYEADPEDFVSDSSVTPEIEEVEHSGIRYHIKYPVTATVFMQNRAELTVAGRSKGFLIYHDISFDPEKFPVMLDFRLAWFRTDDYDSRVYAYEQDITSGFSFSPLYDKGIRAYLLASIPISPFIKASVRFSTTSYFNKSEIGSGYDVTSGHSRSDIKIRIAFAF